jgi:hypothetical protein
MIEPDIKQELFKALHALSDAVPNMRAGRLLAAVGEVCVDLHRRGLWDAEDRELLEAVWKFQQDVESNLPAESRPIA